MDQFIFDLVSFVCVVSVMKPFGYDKASLQNLN